jgi:type I restriction enzyme S subunit
MARVGDILKVRNGFAFKSSDYKTEGVPLIRQSDLGDDVVDITNAKRVSPQFLEELSGFIVREGDLLIGMSGSLGKIARYQHTAPALQNQRTGLLQVKSGHDVRFAKLVLKFVEPQILAEGKGIAVQNVSASEIENCKFPLPSSDEQRRIVAEIEKQFTRLEAGVAALRRVQANLKRYRAAVLKAACEGKLVPTEAERVRSQLSTKNSQPAFETGEQLLQRILAERRKNWTGRGKYKEPAAPATANLPPFPRGWAVASLEQLTSAARPICYGILMPKENVTTGVLFVKVKDMKGDKIDLDSLHRTTPEIAAKYARASLKTGDLLLAIRGTYGRVAEVPKELDGGNITQDTARLDVTGLVDHRYVATCLRNPDCQNYFKRVARGVAVKGVNIGDVRPTPIPLPPLAEQMRIVAEVERRLSVVEELESMVSTNLQRATRLRQSILQKAFAGELIKRGSNNETVSLTNL